MPVSPQQLANRPLAIVNHPPANLKLRLWSLPPANLKLRLWSLPPANLQLRLWLMRPPTTMHRKLTLMRPPTAMHHNLTFLSSVYRHMVPRHRVSVSNYCNCFFCVIVSPQTDRGLFLIYLMFKLCSKKRLDDVS